DSLEEKLRSPNKLDFDALDQGKGERGLYDLEPGRPAHLRFAKSDAPRPSMPSAPALVDPTSRGVLLHFFGNHELLAAELMALAVLRFRSAPTAFLRGLCHTLQEEQRHTSWYISRMQQCGVEFGQYPVNRFFWDSVSTMGCPLDYVSRLSLTFEQANLDYAHHYSGILETAGDSISSKLLSRIYEDEISHVGYGLRWFRRWKSESDSDWAALEKQLVFPLSPIRAKGNQTPFNEEGRKAAGFDEDYIRKLRLYERSRGRTPNVFYFNPDAEQRAGFYPKSYHPPKKVAAVGNNLEALSLFLAKRDDLILMSHPPSEKYRKRLAEAGFHLPEIEPLRSDGRLTKESLLHERKIHQFLPWSKAPNLEQLFPSFVTSETDRTGAWKWRSNDRLLFSKSDQANSLREWFGPTFSIQNRDDLEQSITSLKEAEIKQVVLKHSFSTAGGGMKRLTIADLQDLLDRGFVEVPSKSGGILLEPQHDRVFDFSVQFTIERGKARKLACVEQLITPSGGYRGSIAMPKFCQGMDPEISRFLMTQALPHYDADSPFLTGLEQWAARFDFSGSLGIDTYLYRNADGTLAHRVACEVNPRFTMGRVALELRKKVAPGYGIKLEMIRAQDMNAIELAPNYIDGKLSGGSMLLTEPH
ncbi:MAG: DUF455 family protein, partial [Verrucomicrobiota bacterium]